MQQSTRHDLITDRGTLSLMLVNDTIIAYGVGDLPLVHHVPERHHGRPTRLGQLFQGLHLGGGLIVARIVDAADLVLGFYSVDRDAGFEWGYLWNVDHPERSYWERVERIMASINPADLPRGSKLANLGLQVAFLADDTVGIDPRAVALAVGGVNDRDYEAEQLSDLIEWLTYYRTVRMRR